MCQMTIFIVKGVIHSNEPTDIYHLTLQSPLNST